MDNMEVSRRIKSLCKSKGVTVKKMTETLNISRNMIYDLEKGDRSLISSTLEKIADYLDVSMDYLAGRTDNREINR